MSSSSPGRPGDFFPFVGMLDDAEKAFLKGHRGRGADLEGAVRFFLEFLRGFESLDFEGPSVTVFGSARFAEGHPNYDLARRLGRKLAEEGYTVMTGAGPGIMEAANRGAREAGGRSLGCRVRRPDGPAPNPYVDHVIELEHFFVRKIMLLKYSTAFVLLPGGFGTLAEAFDAVALVQAGRLEAFPIVAMGSSFWKELKTLLEGSLVREGTLSASDVELIRHAESVDEALEIIRG